MQPTLSDVHVNVPLSNLSNMYVQEDDVFVAGRVFPTVSVQKASDRYYTYSRADMNRNLMRKRAPSTESAGMGYKLDNTPNYSVDVWALHHDIDDQVRANYDSMLAPDLEALMYLKLQALISRELDWVSNFFNPGIWTTSWVGNTAPATASQFLQWNDPNSTPIQDVRRAKTAMQLASGGYRGNKLVLGRPVWDQIIDHPDFIERVKYGGTNDRPARIALAAAAALFEVDELLVMDSVQNTGVEEHPSLGLNAGELNSFIGGSGGKAALLTYTPAAPGLRTPGAGYRFAWTGYFGAGPEGIRINSFYIPQIKSTRVEMEAAYAHKLVSADMGAFFSAAVA